MNESIEANYYVMTARNPNRMLLYSMPELPEDLSNSWTFGQKFTIDPKQPIHVEIQEGFEQAERLPFFDHPPIASIEFVDALLQAGVDNLVVYDAILVNEDQSVVYEGYKAINIIGLVKSATRDTVYVGDSKLINGNVDDLGLKPRAINGLLMFRLAKNTATILIHAKVKDHLEAKGFHSLIFTKPGDHFSVDPPF